MPKVRSVVVLSFAALVTAGTAAIGLYRAAQVWKALVTEPTCPLPRPAVSPAPAAVAATCEAPKKDIHVSLLSVNADAVVIEDEGRQHELPGYPIPISRDHEAPRLTTAVVAPDGKLVAIAGACFGASGAGDSTPSCAPVFVRIYRADGAHVRDLEGRWEVTDDRREPLAIAFDERTERLAILVHAFWSDCPGDGNYIELLVYRLADGARLHAPNPRQE